ncbi:MAG TPA: hypothetical protein PK535_09880 [Synergistaceae bacterium]|jgi:hydrogenase-4 component E|nr:hypothetical protein [Synergistaceae bacterium]HQF91660.1 hypothetical protein [Synergistaceae bacterium]HQH79265.1 hypothetical protein [Synergistaceae bacterium]
MDGTHFLSVAILLSTFALVANKRVRSYIRTFQVQSALVALGALVVGTEHFSDRGEWDLLVVAAITLGVKVWAIPRVLLKAHGQGEPRREKDFFYNIPLLVLCCCALTAFAYFAVLGNGVPADRGASHLINAVAVVLMGLFFMISRRFALGQIVGFLVMENGLFVASLFAAGGMPFVVDLGVFVDVLSAVLIMGGLVFQLSEKFHSLDMGKLRKLRG